MENIEETIKTKIQENYKNLFFRMNVFIKYL